MRECICVPECHYVCTCMCLLVLVRVCERAGENTYVHER